MAGLSEHQLRSLDAYDRLRATRPGLFTARGSRPLVLDRGELTAYAAEHGEVLGVAAETPYALFVVDLVESRSPDGTPFRHPYLRVVSRRQLEGGVNVVVVATIENGELGGRGDVVLVEQGRHAPGTIETELPRGFGEPSESAEAAALRELEEETGYVGDGARLLGRALVDSGLTDALVSFVHVPVLRRSAPSREVSEAIRTVRLASPQAVWGDIRSGLVRDGFTVQGLALLANVPAGRAA